MKKVIIIVLKKLYKKGMITVVAESAANVGMSLSGVESASESLGLFTAV